MLHIQRMPANHKVSVAWQIVFTFLPILNLWAFYRIRKLRKYFLIVLLPEMAIAAYFTIEISMIQFAALLNERSTGQYVSPNISFMPTLEFSIIIQAIGWALQGLSIYLVIIWSRQHNNQFDMPATQPPEQ